MTGTTAPVRIAHGASHLAHARARDVAVALGESAPGRAVQLVPAPASLPRTTDGRADHEEVIALVAAVRRAVRMGLADIAVHACADLAEWTFPGLRIAAVTRRLEPRDALVSAAERVFAYLPPGATILTSGAHRRAQILRRRSDLRVRLDSAPPDALLPIIDAGACDAIVAAASDLDALGLTNRIAERIDTDVLIPAAGQAALALEVRADDQTAADCASRLHHEATNYAVRAERACVARLGAKADTPVAVYAQTDGEDMVVRGILAMADGEHVVRLRWSGPTRDAEDVGVTLAELLLAAGGREILSGTPLESTGRYSFRVSGTGASGGNGHRPEDMDDADEWPEA